MQQDPNLNMSSVRRGNAKDAGPDWKGFDEVEGVGVVQSVYLDTKEQSIQYQA